MADDLSPPIVHVLAETPDRFTLMKHDHRNDVRIVLCRAEVEMLVAAGAAALARTLADHEGNLRERERAKRLEDERQLSLLGGSR